MLSLPVLYWKNNIENSIDIFCVQPVLPGVIVQWSCKFKWQYVVHISTSDKSSCHWCHSSPFLIFQEICHQHYVFLGVWATSSSTLSDWTGPFKWWKVTKYIYSSSVFACSFDVLLLHLGISMLLISAALHFRVKYSDQKQHKNTAYIHY